MNNSLGLLDRRDLKINSNRMQQQAESRRRAAVNEMMRQRAAEAGRR
jgi:E1A/CREB-binding protein